MTDWYAHEQFLIDEVKKLEEAEAAYALREAWKKIYGQYPSDKSLAVLWAKSALETGRWKIIHCYNFGNIKKLGTHRGNDDGHYFTMYRCSEILNGKEVWFDPPHYQTHFRAYKTVEAGAEDYIRFVSQKKRYLKAWQEVINGDPRAYSHELKKAGYYTASESLYTAGVVRLFDSFMKRKDELLSWEPEDKIDTIPSPAPEPANPIEEEPVKEDPEEKIDTNIDNGPPPSKDFDNDNEITDVDAGVETSASKEIGKSAKPMFLMAVIVAAIAWVSQFFQSCQ